MSDYISRQAAIDALDKEYRYGADIDRCGLSTALDEIEDIPAADVVPVAHGYWFVDERPESDREVICSVCEEPVFRYHDHIDWRPKYCPHCGAKMDGYCPH